MPTNLEFGPAKKGAGYKWTDPFDPHTSIRIDPTGGTHVHVVKGKNVLDQFGNATKGGKNPDAHIDIDKWLEWKDPFNPSGG